MVPFLFCSRKKKTLVLRLNVVKPYTPAISDAFKVQETPVLDDEGMQKRNY
jgi:hypothetical protein